MWYFARNKVAKTSIKTDHDNLVTTAMTFSATGNTPNQIYALSFAEAIAAGMYTLANCAKTKNDVGKGKLLSSGTFAAGDVIPFTAEYMVKYNLYTMDDVFVAYLQIKNLGGATPTVANKTAAETHLAAMRNASSANGKLARFGTEAFTGHKQMNYTTKAAEITAAGTRFDAVFNDIGEFLKGTDNFDLSDMGFLGNMADRIVAQHAKWANGGTACDKACLDKTDQVFTAIKTIETHTSANVREWVAAKAIADYKKQKAQFG